MALRKGLRGLPGGSSLAQLLAERRAVRNLSTLPDLAVESILAWADAFHQRQGTWPHVNSGAIRGFGRNLRGGSSQARLLAQHRRRRNHLGWPPLSKKKIAAGADTRNTTRSGMGRWPGPGTCPEAETIARAVGGNAGVMTPLRFRDPHGEQDREVDNHHQPSVFVNAVPHGERA
jgi:hypothetical protein